MKTAQEKIEWALKFVDMDLGLLREGDRLNLVADMALFLEEGNAHLAGQIQDGDVLDEIQGNTSSILRTLAERNSPKSGLALKKGLKERLIVDARHEKMLMTSGTLADHPETYLRISPKDLDGLTFDLSAPNRYHLTVTATQLRSAFKFALGMALMGVDVSRLRICVAPRPREQAICGKKFFASHGRQEFCSSQCKNRAALQRFRKAHQSDEDREKERERSRKNYQRKAEAKSGGKVQQRRKK